MGFQVFEKNSSPAAMVPTVTIQKGGAISISRSAYNLIESPPAVELMWDVDNRLVAVRPATVDAQNAYGVRATANEGRGPVVVAGKSFTEFIGLDTTSAQRWIADISDGMIVIDLKKPAQHVVSNRQRGEERKKAAAEEPATAS
jgi:hypothetical protein